MIPTLSAAAVTTTKTFRALTDPPSLRAESLDLDTSCRRTRDVAIQSGSFLDAPRLIYQSIATSSTNGLMTNDLFVRPRELTAAFQRRTLGDDVENG